MEKIYFFDRIDHIEWTRRYLNRIGTAKYTNICVYIP